MFPGVLGASIFKRAVEAEQVRVRLHNIRHYTTDKHHTADDYPYGGGAGMVMKAEPLFRATEWVYRLPDAPPGITQYEPPLEALSGEALPISTTTPSDVPILRLSPPGSVLT